MIQSEPYEVLADTKILPQVVKLTCRLFSDDSESIRTDATKNIEVLIDVLNNPNLLAGLIPTLESRLGTERIVEDCEELRLEQLRLLFRGKFAFKTYFFVSKYLKFQQELSDQKSRRSDSGLHAGNQSHSLSNFGGSVRHCSTRRK